MRDRYRFDILRDGPVNQNLGPGDDEVVVRGRDKFVDQIRLTFNRAEVGNGNANDSNSMPGQDGGLAVRMQAENAAGMLIGPVSRFDDEGITFRAKPDGLKLDIRDLNPAVSIGLFDVAVLGTSGADHYDFSGEDESHYVNAGLGDDRIVGGSGNDYLIGGAGNDVVIGGDGNDVLIGAPGTDRIEGGAGDDTAIIRYTLDGADTVDLGSGNDVVQVIFPAGEVRLTWSTLQTGNGNPNDTGTQTNEDGGLNVRLQAEDSAGNLTGPVSRYDDEGISFIGAPGITFDLRNLSDGVMRGNGYGIVRFGSSGDDVYDDSGSSRAVFHNGGQGNDRLIGGSGADHLVGLDGNDRLEGRGGDDLLVGLGGVDTFVFSGNPGSDTILTYQPGTDKIDLSAYGINASNVLATQTGPNTLIKVDSNKDGTFDFEILLGGSPPPAAGDYIF
jgi:Ca2+-binding RTX toxin-like protein